MDEQRPISEAIRELAGAVDGLRAALERSEEHDRWLSLSAVSQRLGLSTAAAAKLAELGALPAFRSPPEGARYGYGSRGRWKFPARAVDEFERLFALSAFRALRGLRDSLPVEMAARDTPDLPALTARALEALGWWDAQRVSASRSSVPDARTRLDAILRDVPELRALADAAEALRPGEVIGTRRRRRGRPTA